MLRELEGQDYKFPCGADGARHSFELGVALSSSMRQYHPFDNDPVRAAPFFLSPHARAAVTAAFRGVRVALATAAGTAQGRARVVCAHGSREVGTAGSSGGRQPLAAVARRRVLRL